MYPRYLLFLLVSGSWSISSPGSFFPSFCDTVSNTCQLTCVTCSCVSFLLWSIMTCLIVINSIKERVCCGLSLPSSDRFHPPDLTYRQLLYPLVFTRLCLSFPRTRRERATSMSTLQSKDTMERVSKPPGRSLGVPHSATLSFLVTNPSSRSTVEPSQVERQVSVVRNPRSRLI